MSEKRTNILGWLTLISVLAAIWVMFGEGRQTSTIGRGEPLVEGLMDTVDQTRKILLENSGAKLTIVASGSGWSIEERDGYVADANVVRGLLRALALSERREPKTGNQARLKRIGLGADALYVNLMDGDGKSLVALKVGQQRTGADGNSLAYVMVDGEPKSWLVTAVPSLNLNIADWVDNQIISINQERIKTIDFDLVDGIDYALVREIQGADFGLNDIKPGEKAVEGYSLNEAASVVANLSFADVAKVSDGGTSHTLVTLTTFDGLVITLDIVRRDRALWMTTKALYDIAVAEEGAAGIVNGAPADGKLEVDLYNERHSGWQYRLNESDMTHQTTGRDSYIDNSADTP